MCLCKKHRVTISADGENGLQETKMEESGSCKS
jgi:hypothetical protein